MSMDMARVAAARGAAFLDEKDPGWRSRINVAALDLREPCGCVVGQDYALRYADAFAARTKPAWPDDLADPYHYGLHELGIDGVDDRFAWENETRFGFVASVMFDDDPAATSWHELNRAWRELLAPVAS